MYVLDVISPSKASPGADDDELDAPLHAAQYIALRRSVRKGSARAECVNDLNRIIVNVLS
jgi:hypothetical protein